MKKLLSLFLLLTLITFTVACTQTPSTKSQSTVLGKLVSLTDARTQAAEFIDYYNSITLAPKQEEIKNEALSSIPAPCCNKSSIATCCCPCNLAKSVWGLSAFLIAKHNYNAEQVRQAAVEWMQFTNPNGYTGDSCYKGRCNMAFEQNGCGGMDENKIL